MQKFGLGVLVALVFSAGVTYTAQKTDDQMMREIRDRAEIEELMWRYTRALDTTDAAAYAAVYTPDGQFGTGANATKGREALTKMVADLRANRVANEAKGVRNAPMYHMTANHAIRFLDRDRARVDAYYLTAFGAAGQETPLRVAAVGRSIDELVRVNGRWLIKSRNVQPGPQE
jgi:uncharacterized protein (TIGR02246 family)